MRPHAEFDSEGRLISTQYGDVYFSGDGVSETEHVFLNGNNLIKRFAEARSAFVIGETGFGTGLNFLVTADAFLRCAATTSRLVFVTTEQHLLPREILSAAHKSLPEHLHERAAQLRDALNPTPTGSSARIEFAGGRIVLHLLIGDATDSLRSHVFAADAWYLDGFSPARNPAIWSPELLREIAAHTSPTGTCATYTVAGSVRRGLQDVGFEVARAPGFAKKREMLRGCCKPQAHPTNASRIYQATDAPLSTVHVFGAGIAGASAAQAFAKRGMKVTVIDPNGIAKGASGITAAVVRPRLWIKGVVPDAEIITQAFRFTSAWLKASFAKRFQACGALLCARDLADAERLQERIANPATGDVAYWRNEGAASDIAGTQIPNGAAWMPDAGICDIAGLTRDLLAHDNITVCHDIPTATADLCVIATAHGGNVINASIATQAVRGQAISFKWPPQSQAPRTVLCTSGYLAPPNSTGHTWIGSTFDRNSDDCSERESDDVRIRAHFQALPGIANALTNTATSQRFAAIRHTMPDRLPCVGLASTAQTGTPTVVTVAHGSRGAVTGPWAAELLAAAATSEPLNLAPKYWHRLMPLRHQTQTSI